MDDGQRNTDDRRANSARRPVNRRWVLGTLGAGGLAALAGCGGTSDGDGDGDGDGGGGVTTTTTTTTTTTADDGDDTETTTTTTAQQAQTYDNQPPVVVSRPPPAPADAQYQQYSGNNRPRFDDMMDYNLIGDSYQDGEFYSEVARDWDYAPGLIDLELHDDFYYWDGTNITADNFLLHWELENFVYGGDELNAHPNVVRVDKTGEYSLRFSLIDTWRETFAYLQTINDQESKVFQGSGDYYRPWLQRFEDAANQSKIQDLRTELENTTEKDPTKFFHNPFKITDATQDTWKLTLRTPENNVLDGDQVPHYVDALNYQNVEITTITEDQRTKQMFLDGKIPYAGAEDFSQDDLPFETVVTSLTGPFEQWAMLFNCSKPPTSSRHFRRAVAYMTNRKKYMRASGVGPNERVTPFLTPEREDRYVSADVLENLTDYGWDEVREEAATRAMQEGGFERNSDGQWLYKEGERAGDPMEFTLTTYTWQPHVGNQGTDFINTMSDWGIDISVEANDSHWGDVGGGNYELAATYWGGGWPAASMNTTFGDGSGFGAGNPQLPKTNEASPVGEPDGSRQSYETGTMAQRLGVTQDDAQYQELTDQLTWVYNQLVPRLGIEFAKQEAMINNTRFDVKTPSEAPELWTLTYYARLWNAGILSYVPESER